MIHAGARADVARICRRLRSTGLVVGTAGNVSVRRGDQVMISPGGLDYDLLKPEHVGVHDLTGAPVDSVLRPSSELPLHLAAYRTTGAGAVVHTHAPASTALSTLVDEVPSVHYYLAMFGGPVRVAGYATFGSERLAENVALALTGRGAALMANHGAVVVADDVDAALERAEYLEYVCDVALRALGSGSPPRVLPVEELTRVAERLAGYRQEPPDPTAG